MPSHTDELLIRLADPQGNAAAPSAQELSPRVARTLLTRAHWHGVLPAVLARLGPVGQAAPPALAPIVEQAQQDLRASAVRTLLLRQQASHVEQAMAHRGLRRLVIKGKQFADRLYPLPVWRVFRDVDILTPRDEWPQVEELMRSLGYQAQTPPLKHAQPYGETVWHKADQTGGAVEIHWNLVNSPALQRGMSIRYEDLQLDRDGQASAASLLLIAAVHAAASHGFDRLVSIMDIAQATRGAGGEIDECWLAQAARRTGAGLALTTGLTLTARLMREPRCLALRDRLGLRRGAGLCRWLITPGMVLRGHARWDSPRRRLLRQMLKVRR